MSFSKKFLAIIILSTLAIAYMVPVFAQTPAATEPPMECWPQDLCKGNWAQTANSIKSCGAYEKSYGKPLGYCYAKPASVNLQIPIGELKQSATLTQYIPAIYNYAVSIVSIIAIVMIMVGGLQYLTAGGNPGAITSAKERILGAVIGLFLTFGSYILLQTINPALVSLKMPDIKMVRTSALQQTTGGECPADSPQKTGKGVVISNCTNDCGCYKGQTCAPIEKDLLSAAAEFVVWAAVPIPGSGAGTAVASAAKGVGKYVVSTASKVWANKFGKWAIKTVVKGGATYYVLSELFDTSSGATAKSVENGMCVKLAVHTLAAGELCAYTDNCIEGLKCISWDTKQELTEHVLGAEHMGSCVGNPQVFTGELPCTESSTCVTNAGPNPNLACVGGYCSWGAENNTCCESGAIIMKDGSEYVIKYCDKGENKCQSGLRCAFNFGGKWDAVAADYTDEHPEAGLTAATEQGFYKALLDVVSKSSGKCISANYVVPK